MCSNYRPITDLDLLVAFFGVNRDASQPPPEFKAEVWPVDIAPIVRLDANGRRCVQAGNFGLVPNWSKELVYGRRTFNCRTETVAVKPSFRAAWADSQRCIIPAHVLYEPCYESGKPVRWGIENEDGTPIGVAGLYVEHPHLKYDDGKPVVSFTMLTVNGAGHPVYQRMHGPDDEKRMSVFLDPKDFDTWLTCSPDEATDFFKQWTGPLRAYPAPLPQRRKKAPPEPKPAAEPAPKPMDDLFPDLEPPTDPLPRKKRAAKKKAEDQPDTPPPMDDLFS